MLVESADLGDSRKLGNDLRYIYCWNNPRRCVNGARIRIERGLDHEYVKNSDVCWFILESWFLGEGEAVFLVGLAVSLGLIDCKAESGDYHDYASPTQS